MLTLILIIVIVTHLFMLQGTQNRICSKGKVHNKKRKEKLTHVGFALTPTYVK